MTPQKSGIRKIAVMTSGGDAPGLNACIRAIVRTAVHHGLEVFGIRHGFDGMINGEFIALHAGSVSNIIHTGGTILKSSRSEKFKTAPGRATAYTRIKAAGIDAVLLIGGDGSFEGAKAFTGEYDIPIIGIPKTIDNDVSGTDFCIGYDTALNTALQAIDKIRDTAESHNRIFIVEVMGRDAGYLAYGAGLAGGAEAILVPESSADIANLELLLAQGWNRHKSSLIIVVAEGDESGGLAGVSALIKKQWPSYSVGTCVLGHTQRGGNPTAADRILATELGYEAVLAALAGKTNVMIGKQTGMITADPLKEIRKRRLNLTHQQLKMMTILTR